MADEEGAWVCVHYVPPRQIDGTRLDQRVTLSRWKTRHEADQHASCYQGSRPVAVLPWGDDLTASLGKNAVDLDYLNSHTSWSVCSAKLAFNYRIQRALSLRKFFLCEEDGADWYVVALDLEHAKKILRDSGYEFGQEGVPFDLADLTWSELTSDRLGGQYRRDDGSVSPLLDANLGESFCSEY